LTQCWHEMPGTWNRSVVMAHGSYLLSMILLKEWFYPLPGGMGEV
jgi:hypothetical protein